MVKMRRRNGCVRERKCGLGLGVKSSKTMGESLGWRGWHRSASASLSFCQTSLHFARTLINTSSTFRLQQAWSWTLTAQRCRRELSLLHSYIDRCDHWKRLAVVVHQLLRLESTNMVSKG